MFSLRPWLRAPSYIPRRAAPTRRAPFGPPSPAVHKDLGPNLEGRQRSPATLAATPLMTAVAHLSAFTVRVRDDRAAELASVRNLRVVEARSDHVASLLEISPTSISRDQIEDGLRASIEAEHNVWQPSRTVTHLTSESITNRRYGSSGALAGRTRRGSSSRPSWRATPQASSRRLRRLRPRRRRHPPPLSSAALTAAPARRPSSPASSPRFAPFSVRPEPLP